MSSSNARKVRAPRFSDAEWERVTLQARRVASPTSTLSRRRTMTAHEFVREATMRVCRLLEDTPSDGKPLELPDVFAALARPSVYAAQGQRRVTPARAARIARAPESDEVPHG